MELADVFLIVAIVLFAVAALAADYVPPRLNLVAAGLAFFAASFLPLS